MPPFAPTIVFIGGGPAWLRASVGGGEPSPGRGNTRVTICWSFSSAVSRP